MEFSAVVDFLKQFQDRVCAELERREDVARFRRDELAKERGGAARPRVLEDGLILERAAANFSHARGDSLPSAATVERPELAGAPFDATSVSIIVHPRNPYVPTCHANFRMFWVRPPDASPRWWFGGGFDLTPYYASREDVQAWHRAAQRACRTLSDDAYPRFKQWCDDYFSLPHRGEPRGVGGIFFDDLDSPDFDTCFGFVQAAADGFLSGYLPILDRRKDTPYGERERHFQLLRRGRYVEFNLVHDRGTHYGLQAGGRPESILASLPPLVRWAYDYTPAPGSPEAALFTDFLKPQDWISVDDPE